jgi:hypothetical protein
MVVPVATAHACRKLLLLALAVAMLVHPDGNVGAVTELLNANATAMSPATTPEIVHVVVATAQPTPVSVMAASTDAAQSMKAIRRIIFFISSLAPSKASGM